MPLRPLRWFFANQFVHMHTFLMPSARHRSVPQHLRERLARRLRTAIRLAKWRIVIYVLIYSGILAAAMAVIGELLANELGAPWLDAMTHALIQFLQFLSPLSVVALVALVPVNRTLVLLGADIQVLGMEVVARNVKAGGVMPSLQAAPRDGANEGTESPA